MSLISSAPRGLVTAEFKVSVTLDHGDVQQGRFNLLSLPINEKTTIDARLFSIVDVIMDDVVGNGVVIEKMGLAPLNETEARHNVHSQFWFRITNLSGVQKILDEVRVVLIGWAAAAVPEGFVHTDPAAPAQTGDVTLKDKSGVSIPCHFTKTALTGTPGAPGVGINWRDDVNGGVWLTGTEYEVIDGVRDTLPRASSYRCYVAHTAGADTEPGVGVDWPTVWKYIARAGADGAPGSLWYPTTGIPDNGDGENGDLAIDGADGALYYKSAGTWSLIGNLRGPAGADGDDATYTAGEGINESPAGTLVLALNELTSKGTYNDTDILGVYDTGLTAQRKITIATLLAGIDRNIPYEFTDGATITLDWNNGNLQYGTLGGNRAFATPSNPREGGRYNVYIWQDVTGTRDPSWWSGIKWRGGSEPDLSGAAGGSISVITFHYIDGVYIGNYSEDYS